MNVQNLRNHFGGRRRGRGGGGSVRGCRQKGSLRQRLKCSHADAGAQAEVRRVSLETCVSRDQEGPGQLGPEDVFSSMPPLEGLKMLVSTLMTGHGDEGHEDEPMEEGTCGVTIAHFHGYARGWICTYLPETGKLARLYRSMYGTRDAVAIWKDAGTEVLKDSSMKVGVACRALSGSQDANLKGLCHRDDISAVARWKRLKRFENLLDKDSALNRLEASGCLQMLRRSCVTHIRTLRAFHTHKQLHIVQPALILCPSRSTLQLEHFV